MGRMWPRLHLQVKVGKCKWDDERLDTEIHSVQRGGVVCSSQRIQVSSSVREGMVRHHEP